MVTWRIWMSLRTAQAKPNLFERFVAQSDVSIPWYAGMVELAGMLTIVPIIFFTSAVYGIIWVVNISSLIARERQHDTFDVLSMLPAGALGTCWAICVACLQQNRNFANVSSSKTWKGRLVI